MTTKYNPSYYHKNRLPYAVSSQLMNINSFVLSRSKIHHGNRNRMFSYFQRLNMSKIRIFLDTHSKLTFLLIFLYYSHIIPI